jgi:hypothetical protein
MTTPPEQYGYGPQAADTYECIASELNDFLSVFPGSPLDLSTFDSFTDDGVNYKNDEDGVKYNNNNNVVEQQPPSTGDDSSPSSGDATNALYHVPPMQPLTAPSSPPQQCYHAEQGLQPTTTTNYSLPYASAGMVPLSAHHATNAPYGVPPQPLTAPSGPPQQCGQGLRPITTNYSSPYGAGTMPMLPIAGLLAAPGRAPAQSVILRTHSPRTPV